LACVLFVLPAAALAVDATAVTEGTAFAKSIAPKSSSQVVNPAGVDAATWAGNTGTPTAVPSTLGKFSTPNVSTGAYTSAKQIGLAAYGNLAVTNCSTYDPITGDATQTQTCAAINFLSNRCLSPTTQQGAVMAANATGAIPNAADCNGTYGQAQANYGYAEQIGSGDAIFSGIAGLSSSATATAGETCTTQTVIVVPAQYKTASCTKNDSSNEYTCYQYLNASIKTSYTPPTSTTSCTAPAVMQSGFCVSKTSTPAPVVYGCPPGQTLQGQSCVVTSSTPAAPVYTCPPGATLNGTTCVGTSITPGTPSQSCPSVSGEATGYHGGFVNITVGGVTGVCRYTFFSDSANLRNPMPLCKSKFPAPINGATLFDAQWRQIPRGAELTTCTLTPEETCPSGYSWNGAACQELVDQSATITGYNCPTGTLSGTQCVVTTANPANPTYQCPTGTQLSGSNCVSTTQAPPNVTYSCPGGQAPAQGECVTNYVITSWVDTCTSFEASAKTTLPTPH
jgi:hypothetical protein